MFDSPFLIRALVASAIVGPLLGCLSSFIVLNDLAFAGLGITHALIGGIGLGFLIGVSPTFSFVVTSVLVGLIMAFVTEKKEIHETTAISIIFPVMMALGIITLSVSKHYSVDLISYLFGNILLLTKTDIYILIVFSIFVVLWLLAFLKELIFISFDKELAFVSGVDVQKHHYIFMIIVSLSVAVSSKIVGLVLVSALTVIPGATALLFARSFSSLLFYSAFLSFLSAVAGIFLSFVFDIPSGATIVTLSGAIFSVALFAKRIRK